MELSVVKEAAQDMLAEENRQLLAQLADLKSQQTQVLRRQRPATGLRLRMAPPAPPGAGCRATRGRGRFSRSNNLGASTAAGGICESKVCGFFGRSAGG